MERLNKAIYGHVQAGRCRNNRFFDNVMALGFGQAKADPCVFRKAVDGEAEKVIVVHVDGIRPVQRLGGDVTNLSPFLEGTARK